MLNDSDRQAYHSALTAFKGDKAAAADFLKIPLKQFRTNLYNCADLRAVWARPRKVSPPSQNAVMNRTKLDAPCTVEPIQTPEQVEAMAVAADTALAMGVKAIPMAILTADEKQLAQSLHAFQLRHAGAAAEVVHGSVSVTAIKISSVMAKLIARLEDLMDCGQGPENGIGGARNEASLLLEQITKYSAEARKLSEVVGKANVARALIELKKKQDATGPVSRGKPGFRPLVAVNVQPGGTVNLGEKDV